MKQGYGQVLIARKNLLVHRVAWAMSHGYDIPDGLCVLHTCDNPPCCNPDHLWLGTKADNSADMHAKGRFRPGGAGRSWEGKRAGEGNTNAKLTAEDVVAIRELFDRGEATRADIARRYGITWPAVDKIVKRTSWANI
jgi:hypothetical protein